MVTIDIHQFLDHKQYRYILLDKRKVRVQHLNSMWHYFYKNYLLRTALLADKKKENDNQVKKVISYLDIRIESSIIYC